MSVSILWRKISDNSSMKTEFNLVLHDNDVNKNKLRMLSKLEVMFDDPLNIIPDNWFYFTDELPFGVKIKVTLEVIE